jgi:prepilin-type N-terminal cleavage/methylation domain-containing protein
MNRRGFTVVEMIITVTVMGILLTLAVVSVNTSQIKARDDERKTDIASIALALEDFYKTGSASSTEFGVYPSLGILTSEAALKAALPDATPESFLAPDSESLLESFVPALNNETVAGGLTPLPEPFQYVYQPLMADGTLCDTGDTDCRKFNLYYRLEEDRTIVKVTSKNQ